MNSHAELVTYLKESGALRTPELIDAFSAIDRKNFVPDDMHERAYGDYPLPIGLGQTISQPTTVAHMLEWLAPRADDKVLDVGSGSGWTTALLSHVVGPEGSVLGLELVPELAVFGQENLSKYDFSNSRIEKASPKVLGAPKQAPFDKILVSASGEDIPDTLVAQLKNGGTMVVPVRDSIFEIHKDEHGTITRSEHHGFSFVPLLTAKS